MEQYNNRKRIGFEYILNRIGRNRPPGPNKSGDPIQSHIFNRTIRPITTVFQLIVLLSNNRYDRQILSIFYFLK